MDNRNHIYVEPVVTANAKLMLDAGSNDVNSEK